VGGAVVTETFLAAPLYVWFKLPSVTAAEALPITKVFVELPE
jgi:hypothetical protein